MHTQTQHTTTTHKNREFHMFEIVFFSVLEIIRAYLIRHKKTFLISAQPPPPHA